MRIFILLFSVAVLIGIDFWLKYFFHGPFQQIVLACPDETQCAFSFVPLIGEWLGIQLSYNRGIAFWLPLHGLPLQIVTIVLIVLIFFYYIRFEYPKRRVWIDMAFACIFAWALSHAYERIAVGYVVDFISLKYFAIFNFADILISVGAAILFFYSFWYDRK